MPLDPLTQAVLAAFEPHPLRPTEHDLRVELDEERSAEDGIATGITRRIQYAKKSTQHVVAGHRGSGKSTELLCVKAMLEQDDPRVFTVYADVSKDVDYNDVDLLDILVAMVRHLAHDLKQRVGVSLKPGYIADRARRLWNLLKSEVSLESLELEGLVGTLSVAIKGSPDAREQLRSAFEPDAGNWIEAVNDVLDRAQLELHGKGYPGGLCLIVDDLDKLNRVRHKTVDCTIGENLFVNRAPQLTELRCHVVYSVPLELAVSHNAPTLKHSYGGRVPVIPMIKVRHRPPAQDVYADGIEKMREIVRRRCGRAHAKLADVVDSEATLDQLILLSGGQPTELMTLMGDCVLRKRPFDAQTLATRKLRGQREYQFLRKDHWDLIESVKQDGQFERTTENEDAVRELVTSRALLQYLNADVWYRPNPYIEELTRPS
jgi:energy-coupling factor transporter ATP-binding protein EcfA2